MIGRVLLAALLSGIVAGLVMGAIQHVRLTPLIVEAEQFENAGHSHHTNEQVAGGATASQPPAHQHEADAWLPADGIERTFYTTLTLVVTGSALAAILAAISLLIGVPITPQNGVIWGLCGFVAVSLAPAAGLPPELPGMPAADLTARQLWWIGCIASTGMAIYLFTLGRRPWRIVSALGLLLLPHLIGAPLPPSHNSSVPAGLAAAFAANALAANALFWLLIGSLLGLSLRSSNAELLH